MKLIDLLPIWMNENNGVYYFGYNTEQDKNSLLTYLSEVKKKVSKRVLEKPTGNIGITNNDINMLRVLKLKNSLFIVELEDIINPKDNSYHSNSVIRTFLESCKTNDNVMIIIQKIYKDRSLVSPVVGNRSMGAMTINLSEIFVIIIDGVLSIQKCRYMNSDDIEDENITPYLRDIKLDALIN